MNISLPPCPVRAWNNSWQNFDFPRNWCVLDFIEWTTKYGITSTNHLAYTNDQIADGALDAVFVDGDHSYAAVRKDLEFWWKKVRVGGQLLGDDYWMNDVSRAVKEFAQEKNLSFDLLTLPNNDYKIYRFHKKA